MNGEKVIAPRRFVLQVDDDEIGINNNAVVAWGVEFPDGCVVARSCFSDVNRTTIWNSLEDLMTVHNPVFRVHLLDYQWSPIVEDGLSL